MMYDHCRCERRRDRGGREIVDSDSKEERRGEKQTNKKLWIWESERASERQRDYDKRTFFLQKKKKNLRYVDYLLYFMYLLIYL